MSILLAFLFPSMLNTSGKDLKTGLILSIQIIPTIKPQKSPLEIQRLLHLHRCN